MERWAEVLRRAGVPPFKQKRLCGKVQDDLVFLTARRPSIVLKVLKGIQRCSTS
jgi:hypothetical protein